MWQTLLRKASIGPFPLPRGDSSLSFRKYFPMKLQETAFRRQKCRESSMQLSQRLAFHPDAQGPSNSSNGRGSSMKLRKQLGARQRGFYFFPVLQSTRVSASIVSNRHVFISLVSSMLLNPRQIDEKIEQGTSQERQLSQTFRRCGVGWA